MRRQIADLIRSEQRTSGVLQTIIAAIDAEIANRKNDKLGIKFSLALFNDLVSAKRITMSTFSVPGTEAFSQRLPAYRGKYNAYVDLDMHGLDFGVCVPN